MAPITGGPGSGQGQSGVGKKPIGTLNLPGGSPTPANVQLTAQQQAFLDSGGVLRLGGAQLGQPGTLHGPGTTLSGPGSSVTTVGGGGITPPGGGPPGGGGTTKGGGHGKGSRGPGGSTAVTTSIGSSLAALQAQLQTDLQAIGAKYSQLQTDLSSLNSAANAFRDWFFGKLGSTDGYPYSPLITVDVDVVIQAAPGATLPENLGFVVNVFDANGNTVAGSAQLTYAAGGVQLKVTGLFQSTGTYTVQVNIVAPLVFQLGVSAPIPGSLLESNGVTVTLQAPAFYTGLEISFYVATPQGPVGAGHTVVATVQDASGAYVEAQLQGTTDSTGWVTLQAQGGSIAMIDGEQIQVNASAFPPGSNVEEGGVSFDVLPNQIQDAYSPGLGWQQTIPVGSPGSTIAGVGPSVLARWKNADGSFVSGFTADVYILDANGGTVAASSASDSGTGLAVVRFTSYGSVSQTDNSTEYTLKLDVTAADGTTDSQSWPNVTGPSLFTGVSATIGNAALA